MNSCLEAKTAQGVLVSSLEAGPHHDLKVSNSKIVYISSICFQQTTNNFWSTYQYYEVWRQSNHEVWRTLSKLLHQFLNLDIVHSQSRRPAYLGVILWWNHMRYVFFMLVRTRKPTIFTLIRTKVSLSWEYWTPRPLLPQKFWEGQEMIRLILTRGNKTLQN